MSSSRMLNKWILQMQIIAIWIQNILFPSTYTHSQGGGGWGNCRKGNIQYSIECWLCPRTSPTEYINLYYECKSHVLQIKLDLIYFYSVWPCICISIQGDNWWLLENLIYINFDWNTRSTPNFHFAPISSSLHFT